MVMDILQNLKLMNQVYPKDLKRRRKKHVDELTDPGTYRLKTGKHPIKVTTCYATFLSTACLTLANWQQNVGATSRCFLRSGSFILLLLLVLSNVAFSCAMSADVARGHGGDGGGDDRKGTRKPNLGGRRAGRQHTRQETRNLGLKAITDKSGLVSIRFEFDDRETLMPLGEHAAHWANYLGELVRELPLYYPSLRQVPAEQKAGVVARIGMESSATREYPCLSRLNTETGSAYTEDEIMDIVRGGKQRGHIHGVGRVLPGQGTVIPPPSPCTHSSNVVFSQKGEEGAKRQPEIGGGSGSGGRGDNEQGDDEDDGEDGEDDDDS
ncbi:hypothetical protein Tco_0561715 [Tanacetum coccineum]